MINKLFVAGLPYNLSEQELQAHFLQCGTVISAKIIIDRNTGQSKGFGFVEMSSSKEAQEAIQKLNNSNLGDRKIFVNEAKPEENREKRFQRNNNFDKRRNRY